MENKSEELIYITPHRLYFPCIEENGRFYNLDKSKEFLFNAPYTLFVLDDISNLSKEEKDYIALTLYNKAYGIL